MPTSIPNAWVHQFNPMLMQTMQQQKALVIPKLGDKSKRSGVSAAIDTWERVGNVLLQPVARGVETTRLNPSHSRRAATMQTIGGGIYLSSNVDVVRMLIQPQSDYRDLLAAAAVQSRDKAVIDGAIGSATTVTTDSTTGQMTYGSQAMNSSYQIGAATAMDLTRIIAANVLLSKASVPTGAANRVFFYSPGQITDIMAITQASSSDFTKNRIHDAGTIDGQQWQGFDWVEVADVVDESITALVRMLPLPSYRQCIAMYKNGVGFSSAKDPQTTIDRIANMNNEILVQIHLTQGVVRLFEGAVVEVRALEN